MKSILRNTLLLAVFTLLIAGNPALSGSNAAPPSDNPSKETIQAEAELKKLGVPIQKDPKGNVRWIEARQGEMNDKALSLLPSLPELEWLEIGSGIVTADGMKHLGKCTSLKRLYVHDIGLQGDELKWLSQLKKLEALSLQNTKISGKALENLNALDTLKVLNLSGNPVDSGSTEPGSVLLIL